MNLLGCLLLSMAAACGDEDETAVMGPDSAPSGGGTGGAPPGESTACVENPVTHLDLINACTTAVGVLKTPELLLLNTDGSLPPP